MDLRIVTIFGMVLCAMSGAARADYADDIGLNKLRAELGAAIPTGAGVGVSQIEASVSATSLIYMPDTTSTEFTGKTIAAKSGVSVAPSGHAGSVGVYYYGHFSSLAPDVNAIDVYEANAWVTARPTNFPTMTDYGFLRANSSLSPKTETRGIQNHSWIGSLGTTALDTDALRRFDYAIEQSDFLACVGLNNGSGTGIPALLASAYNAISVGLTDGNHSSGTATIDPRTAGDPGRVKPEIVAPMQATSFATPLVSSAGAMLRQIAPVAGRHSVSLKAMLLAGATKDQFANWNRTTTRPLDAHFGAGQVNVFQSYHILAAGQQAASDSVSADKRGWDYHTTSAAASQYFFDIAAVDAPSRLSAVLAWNRIVTDTATAGWGDSSSVADLTLKLYNASGFTKGALVDESASTVDNLEHLYLTSLPAGRYLLEVTSNLIGIAYGLAWDTATNVTVSATAPDAAERENVPATFTITRSGDLTNSLTVPFKLSGSATPGADYTATASPVTIPANQASATIVITPLADSLAEGDESVSITLASGLASTFTTANATVALHDQPIDAWRFSSFTTAELGDPSASGDLADFDRDGLVNLTEYALGLDPKTVNANAVPVTVINTSGFPQLSYTKAVGAVDISYRVEVSTNLVNWNPVPAIPMALAQTTENVTVSSPLNLSTEPIQYLRLRITRE